MSTIKRLFKNTLLLLIAKIVSLVLTLYFTMYSARYLGSELFGILSFALAFSGILGILTDLGMGTLITREISRDSSLLKEFIGNSLFIKIFLSIFFLLLIGLDIWISSYPRTTIEVLYLVSLSIIFSSFSGIFFSVFQAFEKLEYVSLSTILSSILMLIGALIVIEEKLDVVAFAWIYAITNAIMFLFSLILYATKVQTLSLTFDLNLCKEIMKKSLPFAIIGISVIINQRIDRVMLSYMADMTSVGLYSAVSNLVLVLEFIPAAYITSLYPITSRLYSSKEKMSFMLEKSIKYMFIIALPIGVGTVMLAEKIILLIYGNDFSPAAEAFQILVWSEVIIFVGILFSNLLVSMNKQSLVTKQVVLVTVSNIVMNFILIPKYSYIGASIATVMSSVASILILYYFTFKMGYRLTQNTINNCLKTIVACSLMATYIELYNYLSLIFLVISAAIIYIITLLALKEFDGSDFNILRIISKKKG